MKISRRGTSAYYGDSSIQLNTPLFDWDDFEKSITIVRQNVSDFSTDAHHDYPIILPMVDIRRLLEAISDAAVSNQEIFEKELSSLTKSLTQLQAVAAGIKLIHKN